MPIALLVWKGINIHNIVMQFLCSKTTTTKKKSVKKRKHLELNSYLKRKGNQNQMDTYCGQFSPTILAKRQHQINRSSIKSSRIVVAVFHKNSLHGFNSYNIQWFIRGTAIAAFYYIEILIFIFENQGFIFYFHFE